MTEIAIVTDMTQKDLWKQVGTYSQVAQQYGVSTKGAYEVSMLWYQQGLQGAEVMNLTIETLKMAKIAGLDYATATDYMTVAIRGFKLEMEDAQRVTDVYSALAAATASNTEEIAVAMSKTASSAEAVGASMESTSAMIATMISVTREAPENIGSALKSIISRYGEMTTDPTKMIDAEGEAMSLNKVDKALQSVGISLQDANGRFRDFDDVILELAESWDTIDVNTQRYIATVMAGNRQQSRFLALVGNVEEYKKALSTAADSEGAGTIQYLKTMDSIESKMQQMKNAWEQFYSSMGFENLFKGVLDTITKVLNNLNKLGKGQALLSIVNIFNVIKNLVKVVFGGIGNQIIGLFDKFKSRQKELKFEPKVDFSKAYSAWEKFINKITKKVEVPIEAKITQTQQPQTLVQAQAQVSQAQTAGDIFSIYKDWANKYQDRANIFNAEGIPRTFRRLLNNKGRTEQDFETFKQTLQELGVSFENLEQFTNDASKALDNFGNEARENAQKLEKQEKERLEAERAAKQQRNAKILNFTGQALSMIGAAVSTWALTIKDSSEHSIERSKVASGAGQALSGAGTGVMMGLQVAGPWGALIGAILGALTGLPAILDGLNKTTVERIAQLEQEQQELDNLATQKKGEHVSLKNEIEDLKQLEKAQYDSEEAMQAYKDKMNELGEKYPQLIAAQDAEGNVLIDLAEFERELAEARAASVSATKDALKAELKTAQQNRKLYETAGEYYATDATITSKRLTNLESVNASTYLDAFNANTNNSYDALYYLNKDLGFNPEHGDSENFSGWGLTPTDYLTLFQHYYNQDREAFDQALLEIGISSSLINWDNFANLGDDGLYGIVSEGLSSYITGEGAADVTISLGEVTYTDLLGLNDSSDIMGDFKKLEEKYGLDFKTLTGQTEDYFTDLWYTFKNGETEAERIAAGNEVVELLRTAGTRIQIGEDKANKDVHTIGKQLVRADFEEDIVGQALTEEDSKIVDNLNEYQGMWITLGTELLDDLREAETDRKSLESWRDYDYAGYLEAQDRVFQEILDYASTASTFELERLSEIFNNILDYKNEGELRDALKFIDNEKVIESMVSEFNRQRDAKYNRYEEFVSSIDYNSAWFDGLYDKDLYGDNGELILDYLDSFIGVLQQLDEWTRDGLENRVDLMDGTLAAFYTSVGKLSSETQNDLYPIISAIDWNDQASILQAAADIKEYGEKNNINLDDVVYNLNAAASNFMFNIATRIQNFNNTLTANSEKTSSFLDKASEGLDLAEAMNAFDSIAATNEDLTFDDVFVYDKELKKWVYTTEGFNKALEQQNEDLIISRQTREDALKDFEKLKVNLQDVDYDTFLDID